MKSEFDIRKAFLRAILIGLCLPYLTLYSCGHGYQIDEASLEKKANRPSEILEAAETNVTTMRRSGPIERIYSIARISAEFWNVYLLVSCLVAIIVYVGSLALWRIKKKSP